MSLIKGLTAQSRLLVVDHQPGTAELMKIGLGKLGLENITFAPEGFTGIKLLKKTPFDLMIVRQSCPLLGTTDFVKEVLADINIRWRPIVTFDSNLGSEEITALKRLGVEYNFSLPLSQKAMTDAIQGAALKQLDVNYAFMRLERSRVLCMEGKFPEAEEMLKTLLESERLNLRAQIRQVHLKRCMGDFDGAAKACLEIIKHNSGEAELFELLGEIRLQMQDLAGAVTEFTQALTIAVHQPYRFDSIASSLVRHQHLKEAESVYRKAIEAGHNIPPILDGLATNLMSTGQREEAVRYFVSLSQLFPTDVKYLNNLAVCYKGLGRLDDAVDHYKKALEIESNSKVMYNLGLLFIEKKDLETAKDYLRRAIDEEPDNERFQLKLLQIVDPKAYQEKLKELNSSPATKGKKDQYSYRPKPVKLEPAIVQTLEGVLGTMKSLPKPAAFRPANVPSFKLDVEVYKRIQSVDDIQLKHEYLEAVNTLRKGFDIVTQKWLLPLAAFATQSADFIANQCTDLVLEEKQETTESLEVLKKDCSQIDFLKKLQKNQPALSEPIGLAITHYEFLIAWNKNLSALINSSKSLIKMPENLWREIEWHFPVQTDRDFIKRSFDSFAGKIPERPGPEVMEGKGNAPRRIANLETDFAHWRLFNYVFKKLVDSFSSRLDDLLPETLKQVSPVCGISFMDADQRKLVFDIAQDAVQLIFPGALHKIEDLLSKQNQLNGMLATSLRSLRVYLEIRRKFLTYHDFITVFSSTHVDQIGPSTIKDKMSLFGANLDYVWVQSAARSRTTQERDTFKHLAAEAQKISDSEIAHIG